MHFRALVTSLLCRFSVEGVGIESPAYGGGPFSEAHFGLMMFSLEAVFEARKDTVLFDPTTLKLMAAGKGDAGKGDMQKAVQKDTMSPEQIQNDEADAYCVAKHAARFFMFKNNSLHVDELSPQEKRVFLERKKKTKRKSADSGMPAVVKRTAYVFRENSRFFSFSSIPSGDVKLPEKSQIDPNLLSWLEK